MAIKKLSEFVDDDAIRVTGKLLIQVRRLIKSIAKETKDIEQLQKDPYEMLSTAMDKCPDVIRNMLAILSETPFEEYHCTAVTVMNDAITMFQDEELLELFGSQS